MLKIEISLYNYNKLRAKEEILTQLSSLSSPSSDFASVLASYKKMQTIIESLESMIPSEYNELDDVKIKMNRKVYDYYLNIQMIFGQISDINVANANNFDSLVQYWNTFFVYRSSFKELIKKKTADVEEFNTLVKIEKENRLLKKKNVELENLLNEQSDDELEEDFYDFN